MDLKARNKAVNIVFSILIFVLTTAMFYGFYMSPIMLISGDGFGPQLTLTEMFESAIEYFKNFSNNASSGPDVFINGFMTNGMFLIMFAVNIIVYFVHYIVVTVKTAQGLAGKDVNKDIIRHLLSMITAVVVYIATLLSIYHVQSDTAALTIGTGPMVMLAICIVLFVLCAIIKVSGDDKKKPATRVFKVIISFLSLGATMAVLSSMYSVHGVSFNIRTLIVDTFTLLAAAAQGGSPDFKVIMTLSLLLLAICFVYAAHSTFSKLIVHSFEVEPTKKDKTKIKDVGTSLIVRSSLALAFTGAGLVLTIYALKEIFPGSNVEYSWYLIASAGAAFISLVLAIFNKAMGKKREEDEPEKEDSKESKVVEEPKEDAIDAKYDFKDKDKTERSVEKEPEESNISSLDIHKDASSENKFDFKSFNKALKGPKKDDR